MIKLKYVARRLISLLPKRVRLHALTQLGLIDGAIDPELKQLAMYMPQSRRRVAFDIGANNGVTSTVLSRVFRQCIRLNRTQRF